MIEFDFKTYNSDFNLENEKYHSICQIIKDKFENGELKYWTTLDSYISKEEIGSIKKIAEKIKKNSDVLVVIGIGGSYMGSQAIISAFEKMYERNKPEIIFLGTGLSSEEYNETLDYIKDKRISVNVISKSGTTLEPSIAFNLIMDLMNIKYSEEELKERVIVTTDKEEGLLRKIVNEKGYASFIVPTNIGGRFSVLTPVGLLPIAVSGVDIDSLLNGANKGMNLLDKAIEYAVIREMLSNQGKIIESYTIYNKKLTYFTEWLKQLFAETQGKCGKGILPISNINTRDLHSMGQFLQEGTNIVFETVIGIKEEKDLNIERYSVTLNELNKIALEKVALAHKNGKTPSILIWMDEKNEENLGQLIQFFIYSAIIGALLLNVNPFDQPGVQEYKKLIQESIN